MKKLLISLLAVVQLIGCGGENALQGGASSGSSASSTNTAATISVIADSPQLQSEGNVPVAITATVKDANNVVIPNVAVAFSTTSGDLTVTEPTTDSSGQAKATLAIGSDPSNRAITVTVVSGLATSNVSVNVVGTTLSVTGSTSLVLGASGSYTATLLNSGGKAISGVTLAVASSNNNGISASNLVTDSTGKVNFQLLATNAGGDTISVTGLGLTATQSVNVSGQSFQFTSPASATKINIGSSQAVAVRWTNNGVPVVGQTINFSATRGTLTSATAVTNSSGDATVSISSSASGPAIISAVDNANTVSALLDVSFLATTPASIALQSSPATIPTQGQSTLTATVRDANGNLVEGKQVDFSIASGTGALSLPSAITNAQGQAQTVYTASNTASGSNGITLSAAYSGGTPATTTLTVGGQSVFLSMGTGNKLGENDNKTLFLQPWVIQAVDSAGNPVASAPITLTVHSRRYAKGKYIDGTTSHEQVIASTCLNEDVNLNGTLDAGDLDANTNGQLDPGDKAVASPGTVTTGADGSATFSVNYPENYGNWLEVVLTATANVNGTESSTTTIYWLPMLATYINDLKVAVPGDPSPFGQNGCSSPD